MKKIIVSLFAVLLSISFAMSQNMSIVNGVWERGKVNGVKLFEIKNGSIHEIASSKQGEDGKFMFAFSPVKEGYYVVGLSNNKQHRYTFYFKPGDQLNLKITPSSYELFGDNTPENKEITRWHDFIFPLEDKSVYFQGKKSTYVDFFPLFEEKQEELKSYPKSATPNTVFNNTFEEYKKIDLLSIALTFIQTPRSAHPQGEDFIDYYRQIDLPGLTRNTALLNYPNGVELFLNSYMTSIRINDELQNSQKAKIYENPAASLLGGSDLDKVINDTIKGELTIMLSRQNKTLAGFSEYKKNYGKYVITDSQKERFRNVELALNKNTAGEDAIDFKFADISGKEIALSDFKGKVVYIDVWATWCGPCKREFPFMKEIEKQYHGNDNMVFMGVNVDISKDIEKWKTFLEKEQLPGVQIFAGDAANQSIMMPYNIKGIPRFILVGKDGKLISADAPRPSSPELKAMLDDALKK